MAPTAIAIVRQPWMVERFHNSRAPIDMPWLAPPAVLDHGVFSTWADHATLVRRGERIRHVDILVEGRVDEIVSGLVIPHDEPGSLLGGDGAIEGGLSTSTIRARSRVVVVTVSVPALRRVAGSPEVAFWLGEHLSTRDHAIQSAAECCPALLTRWLEPDEQRLQ